MAPPPNLNHHLCTQQKPSLISHISMWPPHTNALQSHISITVVVSPRWQQSFRFNHISTLKTHISRSLLDCISESSITLSDSTMMLLPEDNSQPGLKSHLMMNMMWKIREKPAQRCGLLSRISGINPLVQTLKTIWSSWSTRLISRPYHGLHKMNMTCLCSHLHSRGPRNSWRIIPRIPNSSSPHSSTTLGVHNSQTWSGQTSLLAELSTSMASSQDNIPSLMMRGILKSSVTSSSSDPTSQPKLLTITESGSLLGMSPSKQCYLSSHTELHYDWAVCIHVSQWCNILLNSTSSFSDLHALWIQTGVGSSCEGEWRNWVLGNGSRKHNPCHRYNEGHYPNLMANCTYDHIHSKCWSNRHTSSDCDKKWYPSQLMGMLAMLCKQLHLGQGSVLLPYSSQIHRNPGISSISMHETLVVWVSWSMHQFQ